MRHKLSVALVGFTASLLPLAVYSSLPGHDKRDFTDEFECHSGTWANSAASGATNTYFPLVPGSVAYLSNQACIDEGECDTLEEVTITVLFETEMVDGVETRIVEEFELEDGEEVETSRNFFAECVGSGDVFYFGESVVDGDGEPLPDAWRAGENGARAGIIMPGGTFLIGARYFQEVAPNALDRGEHIEKGLSVELPAGDFEDCVLVNDTNALEDPKGKDGDEKIYCPGVGLTKDEDAELVSYSP